MTQLTASRLRELLNYESETGQFRWKIKPNRSTVRGSIAGGRHSLGYGSISIDDRDYLAHRLAWLYVHGRWPKHQIDHINGDRSDNRLENLREADNSENNRNRGVQKNNKSGFKGVGFHKQTQKWRAKIKLHGKNYHLGLFDEVEDAARAYSAAAERLHGDFARIS